MSAPNSHASGSRGAVRQVNAGRHQSRAGFKAKARARCYLAPVVWVVKVTWPSPAICAACIT